MMPFALHGGSPLTPLRINEYLAKLREELAEGKPVFETLISRYFLSNQHKIVLEMNPSAGFIAAKNESEAKLLSSLEKSMSEAEKKTIISDLAALKATQDAPQSLDQLPSLHISDISPQVEAVPYHSCRMVDSLQLRFIKQPTNGISYVRIKVDVTDMPAELREKVPLYVSFFNKMGTRTHSHADFDNLKDLLTTGGVRCSLIVGSDKDSLGKHKEMLLFSIGFLNRNTAPAFSLLQEALTGVNFHEHGHSSLLLQRSVKARTDDLIGNGVSFASSLSAASLTPAASAYEILSSLRHDCKLASETLSNEEKMQSIAQKLDQIHRFSMNRDKMEVCIHASDIGEIEEEFVRRLGVLSAGLHSTFAAYDKHRSVGVESLFTRSALRSYFTLQGRVNFVVESFLGVHYTHPDYAVLSILAELMTANFLHKEIREKGGAYGSGFQTDPQKGILTLFSYRDPRNLQTYDSFRSAIQHCSDGQFE
jgi:hypothetical protein